MKTKTTLVLFLLFFLNFSIAQNLNSTVVGGEYIFTQNETPCLSQAQRELVKTQIKDGIQLLKSQNRLAFNTANRGGGHPLFAWPIRKAVGINYNNISTTRHYVDHNAAYPNQVSDFDCGTKTYDTPAGYNHLGTDLVTWPFGWKMMDDDGVEIIAAAPGQILYKYSTQFDRSCSNNNNFWNTVYILHDDGSVAAYGHMKKNSLTTKAVGEMVVEGEFLGIVGSSGNSAVPHLHFEVYSEIEWEGVGQDVLIDPYTGPCNTLNTDSWWQNQRPHKDPKINAVLTHTDYPVFPDCPQLETTSETTNESNDFDVSDTVYFAIYLSDQLAGSSINLKIIRPDNSILYDWDFALNDYHDASWWIWYYSGVYNMNGEWKWQATYQGETVTHNFNITGALSVEDKDFTSTSIYPNPFNDLININSTTKINKASVVDILGKTVLVFNENSDEGLYELNLAQLSKGIYFIRLEGDNQQIKTVKLIKK